MRKAPDLIAIPPAVKQRLDDEARKLIEFTVQFVRDNERVEKEDLIAIVKEKHPMLFKRAKMLKLLKDLELNEVMLRVGESGTHYFSPGKKVITQEVIDRLESADENRE